MKQSCIRLGWRSLWRDLRAGELRLLIVAVALAVAALAAVAFFADRLQNGLQRDARQLLGGDAVVVSDQPPPEAFVRQAQALGLRLSTSSSFPTMARASDEQGGASRLVALKTVQAGYPLRGRIELADHSGARLGQPASGIPAPGTAWVDDALLAALEIEVGDTVLLGDSQLRVTRVIVLEPDRGSGFMSFAPRLMMNEADLAATGLVQPASRIRWRMALASEDEAQVRAFVDWAEQQIKPAQAAPALRGLRVESLDRGRPEMERTLGRAEKFLSLVALLSALLSAVAVAIAARGFAARHLDDCAMLRVLGQSQRTIAWAYTFEFVLAGLFASLLGVLLGWSVHLLFVQLLAGLVTTALPAASVWPALLGAGVGLVLLVAFGLPPVLQLAQVPPLRVIRRDVGQLRSSSLLVLLVGVAGFAALLMAVARDWTLGAIAVGGFAAAVLLFALLSWAAVWLLRRCVHEQRAPRWLLLAARQITARPLFAMVQTSALAMGLLALVLLVLLRTDLIDSWRQATPADAPNRFVINIQPDQAQPFRAALREQGVSDYDWYPMVRGRLIAINGQPVDPSSYPEERAQELLEREFNLSYAAEQPLHNPVVAGRWTPNESGGASVETGLAETLGLKLGDRLEFDMGGISHSSTISSLRKVDWSSMHANFFVMFPLAEMPDLPVTYLAAFRAPPQRGFDNQLVRQFPNITNVDMTATLAQVQRVLDQVIRAVEFLFGFTLAAGLVVLLATVGATREERAREFAIMRALGASSALLRQVQRAELLGVGLLAGLLASLVAMAVGWALARYVFDFSWTGSLSVPLAGALAGGVLAWSAGWWALRGVLTRPVVATLRQSID
jgi:putative ABC transport system permease protein